MSKPPGKTLKELELYYYARLAAEGFCDAEDPTRDDRPLHEWHAHTFRRRHGGMDSLTFEAIRDYYIAAGQLLHTYPFKNPTHRKIWELHCEGKDLGEIARAVPTLSRTRIHFWIQQIAKEILGHERRPKRIAA